MKFCLAAYLAAATADMGSTAFALQHGAHEAVLTQNIGVNTAILAGETAAMTVALRKLSVHHPTLAKTLAIGATSFRLAVTRHNLRVGHAMGGR